MSYPKESFQKEGSLKTFISLDTSLAPLEILKSKSKSIDTKVKTISEELEFLRALETERYQDVNVLFDLYVM